METNVCESCEGFGVQWELISEYNKDEKYRVCSNCLHELTNYNLSKEHFKNLIKNGHNDSEFLLHGDFYDEDGNAQQPFGE